MDFAEYLLKRAIVVGVVILAVTLGGVAALKRWGPAGVIPSSAPAAPGAAVPSPMGVRLTIDFGDGFSKTYERLAAGEGATVLGVLIAAQGGGGARALAVDATGAGATGFVRGIDGVMNATDSKYWQFRVNGVLGSVGAGVAAVKPGDSVTWTFGPYEASPTAGPKAGTEDERANPAPRK